MNFRISSDLIKSAFNVEQLETIHNQTDYLELLKVNIDEKIIFIVHQVFDLKNIAYFTEHFSQIEAEHIFDLAQHCSILSDCGCLDCVLFSKKLVIYKKPYLPWFYSPLKEIREDTFISS